MAVTSLEQLHDCEIHSYRVDGEGRTLRFALWPPKGIAETRESFGLVFCEVEGYLIEHDLGVNIVLAFEEQPLDIFVAQQAARFERESQWGWPLFWKGSVERTASWLSERGSRVG